MNNKSGRLYSLQWLRIIAAALVVFYHAAVYLQLMRQDERIIAAVPGWAGPFGVTLFFALSGYLMSLAMQRQKPAAFLLHRIVRIYPIFIIVVSIFLLAGFVSPLKLPLDWRAMTLMPVGAGAYPLGVEWTLIFEIAFYVFVFGIMICGKTAQMPTIVVGWLGLILAHNILWPDDPTKNLYNPFNLPFVAVNVGFAAGMVLPRVLKLRLHPLLALVIAVDLWLLGQQLLGLTGVRWGMGLGAGLVVLSLAQFQGWRFVLGDSVLGRLGGKLGDYSYALYLCHVPVIRTVYAAAPPASNDVFLFALAVVGAVALSIILGEIDIRMYRFLKRRVDQTGEGIQAVLVSVYVGLFFGFAFYFGFFGGVP